MIHSDNSGMHLSNIFSYFNDFLKVFFGMINVFSILCEETIQLPCVTSLYKLFGIHMPQSK